VPPQAVIVCLLCSRLCLSFWDVPLVSFLLPDSTQAGGRCAVSGVLLIPTYSLKLVPQQELQPQSVHLHRGSRSIHSCNCLPPTAPGLHCRAHVEHLLNDASASTSFTAKSSLLSCVVVQLFVCHSESISLNLDTRTEGAIPSAEQPRLAVITLDPNSSSSSSGSSDAVADGSSSGSKRAGSLRLMTETSGDFPTINPRCVKPH
jgi:hypothetical protein